MNEQGEVWAGADLSANHVNLGSGELESYTGPPSSGIAKPRRILLDAPSQAAM